MFLTSIYCQLLKIYEYIVHPSKYYSKKYAKKYTKEYINSININEPSHNSDTYEPF